MTAADETGGSPRAWPVLSSRPGPEMPLFSARLDRVRHPRTGRRYERVVLETPDWVNVVAVTEDRHVVLVRQYRFGTRTVTLEIPGGMVDDGEAPEEAARRELLEETGFAAPDWTTLATVAPNPAFLTNLCHHFLARGAVRRGAPRNEGGEDIQVVLMPIGDLPRLVRSGAIDHSLVISAVCRLLDLRLDPESP